MTDRLNPEALEAGAQSMECQCSKHVIDCGEYYADCPRHVHYPNAVSAYLAALTEPDSTLITDELTRVVEALHGYDCPDDPDPGEACTCDGDTYYRMAEVALEAAALPSPRTITTVEELEELPTSAYVEDMHGDRGVVFNEHIWYPETKPLMLGYALKHYGPFTVLWVPAEGGGESTIP